MNLITKHKKLQRDIQGAYNPYVDHCKHIQAEMDQLVAQGMVRAAPYWRRDKKGKKKYLYLIHATGPNGSRRREYIGCDRQKINDAFDAIRRQVRFHKLNMELKQLRLKLEKANQHLIKFLEEAH